MIFRDYVKICNSSVDGFTHFYIFVAPMIDTYVSDTRCLNQIYYYINASHPGQAVPKLRAVRPARCDYNSQHGCGRGSGGSHYNNGRCDIFVSRLQPSASARDVIINLESKFNRNFRVELLQTKYDHYASFKVTVTVPITFKKDLLNKDNWDDNHVFVKSFVKRSSPRF